MMPGNVVSIRVSPRDTMSVIDLVEYLKMPLNSLSFPAMVSLALSSYLELLRQQKLIPDRTGFEYSERITGVIGTGKSKRKHATTAAILAVGSELKIKLPNELAQSTDLLAGQTFVQNWDNSSSQPTDIISTEQRLARRSLAELVAKKDLADSGAPGVNWSESCQREFEELHKIVYGA
ncbi:MAG: hypothetical protein DDT42_01857 [candidate division WS2 bacterium]|uniref:Uncharacterized protein n=1 Tax=Psychracetigena formicireducens TaxID=2986056 RepID=A0A9E2F7U6_PSYF1|nr:hypothetical protein [Candidatus Psychracetigena formicireducens]